MGREGCGTIGALMDCPRCGFAGAEGPACPRCGVVFAKLRPRAPIPPAEAPLDVRVDEPASGPSWTLLLLVFALGLSVGVIAWLRSAARSGPERPASHAAL